jgi:hypothetical protein
MENKPQNFSTDEIIDFDDEYCEIENTKLQAPNEVPQPKINQILEEEEQQFNEEDEANYSDLDENIVIYNTKVKELNDLDKSNKQAIINILMDENLITTKPINTNEYIKEKNRTKYSYVRSILNTYTTSAMETQEKKNTYGRTGFQINTQEGDPEYIKDINVAAVMLKPQIIEENKDVAKLLFNDINKKKKKKHLSSKQIGERVKNVLDIKKKNLQKIENEINEKERLETTFSPSINHRKKDGGRRNLTNFLKLQNEFQKKVQKKRRNLYLNNESEIKELIKGKPQLDKHSVILAKKNSGNEPAYMRLYNRRTETEERRKLVEMRLDLDKRDKEKKRKRFEDEYKRNNPYRYVKSKFRKENPFLKEKKIKRVRSAEDIKSNILLKNFYNINNNNNLIILDYNYIQLYRVHFNKFISNFDISLKILSKDKNEKNNSNRKLEELYLYQYHKLLFILGMARYPPPEKNEKEDSTVDDYNLKTRERKLIKDSFNLMKKSEEKIKTSDVKNFLICVLNLQNYNLYQIYKSKHEHEIKDMFPPEKYKKEEIPELILNKQNEELISKINKKNTKNNKYISFSKDGEIIFTLEKSFLINRDFNKFAVNYRSQKNKIKEEKLLNIVKKQCPFKPEIGAKSTRLYEKYKDKIFSYQNDTVTSSISNIKKARTNMNYFDIIILLDKKKIAENKKIKEEMEQKQIKECTFRPKISNYLDSDIKKGKESKNNKSNGYNEIVSNGTDRIIRTKNKKKLSKNKNIFDELYEDGMKKLKLKRDKSQDQIDIEEQKEDLTFQPNIKHLDPKKIPRTSFDNDIYNEKEYKFKYERLKHGRLERMLKECYNERYELNNEMKQFIKDNKEFNYIQNQQYYDIDDPFYYNNSEINMMNCINSQYEQTRTSIKTHHTTNRNKSKAKYLESNIIIDDDTNTNAVKEVEPKNTKMPTESYSKTEIIIEKDKKEEIPLLIIDVCVGEGIKKKIFVFEGDTPESLADNFATEFNLDQETKNRLQNLIHSHMVRLLTRIDEENPSNSDKKPNNDPIIK